MLAELSQSASNCNTHHWWSCVNRMLGLKPKDAIPPLLYNLKFCHTADEKPSCLNSAFAAQCSAPQPNSTSAPAISNSTSSFSFDLVSSDEVGSCLTRLCKWKTRGMDNLSQLVLKECALEIAVPLIDKTFTLGNIHSQIHSQFTSKS